MKNKMKSKIPLLVKIISIILLLFAAKIIILGFIGLLPLLGGDIQSILEEDPKKAEEFRLRFENRGIEYNKTNLLLLTGLGYLLIIIFCAFLILLGLYLWNAKNWARITIIIFAFIFAFINLFGMLITFNLSDIVGIIISLAIGFYLLFSKDAKAAFKKKQ